jgi:F1F0 ATPase subunit 2
MDAQAMIPFDLAGQNLIGHLVGTGAWLASGALIGVFHFLTLRWNVQMFAAGQRVLLPLGIQLARFMLISAALAAIIRCFGVLPLLAAIVGIQSMRTAIIRLAAPE